MKSVIGILIFSFCSLVLFAQQNDSLEQRKGTVSYVSSQNIYVKFSSTEGIEEGDTLYMKENGGLSPAVHVQYISSSSCAGVALMKRTFRTGEELIALIHHTEEQSAEEQNTEPEDEEITVNEKIVRNFKKEQEEEDPADFHGRVSVSSYSNFTNSDRYSEYQRWRYVISMKGNNLGKVFSEFDSYVAFSYRNTKWDEVSDNLSEALKIYNLAGKLNLGEKTALWLGRKMNRDASNIGAVDGAQLMMDFDNWHTGVIIGSRPNFSDYNYNMKLFQFGAYGGRSDTLGEGYMKNTLGVFEQTNDFSTDRRFLYLQHNNTAIENVSIFASTEVDLYKKEYGEAKSTFRLTSLYLSTRYAPSRFISFSLSYDARKNVVYYETFKSIADSVLEDATRQGFRFRINLRPSRLLFAGLRYGYRYREGDLRPTNNAGFHITYSRIPYAELSAGLSYNYLSTGYLEGGIAGLRFSRDIIPGILSGSLSYRNVQYRFTNTVPDLSQDLVNLDLTGRLSSQLFLSLSFEATFQEALSQKRVYVTLNQRF